METINKLNKIGDLRFPKYNVSILIIGVFSSGGAVAVGYAECLLALNATNRLNGEEEVY